MGKAVPAKPFLREENGQLELLLRTKTRNYSTGIKLNFTNFFTNKTSCSENFFCDENASVKLLLRTKLFHENKIKLHELYSVKTFPCGDEFVDGNFCSDESFHSAQSKKSQKFEWEK